MDTNDIDNNDSLEGGFGDDNLSGEVNANFFVIIGFDGNGEEKSGSFTYNGSEPITSKGSAGNDSQISGSGHDYLDGKDGDDYLQGNAGNDAIYGRNGYDELHGNSGTDYLAGGHDNDTLSGGEDNDSLFGGIGDDTLLGDSGNDYLAGDNDNDYLDGGEDNDTLHGEYGNDIIIGGNGYDIATYIGEYTAFGATFTSNGSVQITGGEGTDLLSGIEQISFGNGGFYNVYTGDAGANNLTADANVWSLLYGGNGSDSLTGSNYNDTLTGGNSNDTLDGGSGYDIATYFGQYPTYGAAFTNDGAVQITGSEGTDLLYRIERISFGDGGFYNVYTGDASANSLTADANVWSLLYGGEGNDTLIGGNYNDTLDGGNGNDSLNGGGGNDALYGGNDIDILDGGEGDDFLSGYNGDDFLQGDAGSDTLYGDDGNDTLYGNGSDDNLVGGYGNDSLIGGDGNDYINGYGSTLSNDTQYDWLTGAQGFDLFVLGEKDKVFYNETGDGYAVIENWDPRSGDFDIEYDRIQLAGNASQYKLEFTSVSGIGTNAQDTEIFFNANNSWERIGIVRDSTNVNLSRDFGFV